MKQLYIALVLCAAVLGGVRPAFATQYSCLSIVVAAKACGRWPAIRAWIDAADLADEWGKCQYVSDDYPQFAAITNALVASGTVTADDVDEILAASVDTAMPDDLLMRRYRSDVSTASGRAAWHGKLVRQVVDTNLWQRTSVYADGTRFVDRAAPPKTPRVRRPGVAMTNGVPVRLAAARRRWAERKAAGGVTNVTVTVTAGQ